MRHLAGRSEEARQKHFRLATWAPAGTSEVPGWMVCLKGFSLMLFERSYISGFWEG